MWYILIISFLIAGILFGSKLGIKQTKFQPKSGISKIFLDSPLNENDTIKAMFSKKQIDKKLKVLAESPAPKKLSEGAMCYDMAYVDNSVHEYICPVCGEKTIYKKTKDLEKFEYIDGIFWQIEACRREIQNIKGINIQLDEKQFCSHCSPKVEKPEIHLLVNIAGQKDTTKISNFNYMDIRIIQEFLDDKLIHQDDQDFESPLKDNILRIKELLGIKS